LKSYPALDIRSNEHDALYAALDDFSPTAIEELPDGLRAFFSATEFRDRALAALSREFKVSSLDVSDEDWARRSQENLRPIRVDRITVTPRFDLAHDASPITILIQPSMGFGTGHHATTRLCLSALQSFEVSGKTFLDIGTGSGVLAIAAARLGAANAKGIDTDPDAIQSARHNLECNPEAAGVSFDEANLETAALQACDIIAANLTGALLVRSASTILGAAVPGGLLILSGLMRHERDEVQRAFGSASTEWERFEDEWVGLVMKKP
jgi:ribosomal protein L11 methyltransferase